MVVQFGRPERIPLTCFRSWSDLFLFLYFFKCIYSLLLSSIFHMVQEGRKDKREKGVSQRPFPLQKISSLNSSTCPTLTSIRSPLRLEQETPVSLILVSHVACRSPLVFWGQGFFSCKYLSSLKARNPSMAHLNVAIWMNFGFCCEMFLIQFECIMRSGDCQWKTQQQKNECNTVDITQSL